MSRELPIKPNLEHLKRQAKELLHSAQQNDSAALERVRAAISFTTPADLKLADAQHVIAREYGFATWPNLKEHVDTVLAALQPAEMLTAAIRASDSAETARLLAGYPHLRAQIDEPLLNYGAGMHAMIAAVQRGDRQTIDVLLAAGADINARSRWWSGGIGVLDECASDMAPFLMERGAVLDAHAAARLGLPVELRQLVAANPAVVNQGGYGGQTPLHFASTVEIAAFLLEHGAAIDARDLDHESTPAQHMIRVVQARHYRQDRQDIARYLVQHGCRTDILMASALGDLELVRRHVYADPDCVRMRVDDNYFPKKDSRAEGTIYVPIFGPKRTPHMVARDFGHEDVFDFLMDHSPEDVKIAQACELGDEELFRAMLAKRPGLVEHLTGEDRRRLPDAAQNNNLAGVRLMLAAGWPVEATGEYGLTPLAWAAWHGNAEMVRAILQYHPEIDRHDSIHEISALGSALHGSENSWHRDTGDYGATVEALLDAGAKAPPVTDDLEASPAAREVLLRHEQQAKEG